MIFLFADVETGFASESGVLNLLSTGFVEVRGFMNVDGKN